MKIALEFIPVQSPAHQCRLRYAFQLFCAVYGHDPVLDRKNAGSAELQITYSGDGGEFRDKRKVLRLHNGYRVRPLAASAPRPHAFSEAGRTTVLFYPPEDSAETDWLAEIFEWTSCAHEYSVTERDPLGRIPFEETVFQRFALDPCIPYAALAMWFLQHAIRKLCPAADERARSPEIGFSHAVVCSHDVDFIALGYLSTLVRLAKNTVIALLHRSPTLSFGIAARTVQFALGGRNPLRCIEQLAMTEQTSGIGSSFNFIVRHGHRRDANYRIEDRAVIELAQWLQSISREIGLHGSYTSLDNVGELAAEFHVLQAHGFQALGERQHWLRFSLERLIPELEMAGALFDTSLGWQNRTGFRAGACFPFPPYNFVEERPARFLELPLAIMDKALPAQAGKAFTAVANLLAASRTYGWGGISLLWHPEAFGGGQQSTTIGRTFYELANRRSEWNDTWLSAADFVRQVCHRYLEAGLFDRDWGVNLINAGNITQSSV